MTPMGSKVMEKNNENKAMGNIGVLFSITCAKILLLGITDTHFRSMHFETIELILRDIMVLIMDVRAALTYSYFSYILSLLLTIMTYVHRNQLPSGSHHTTIAILEVVVYGIGILYNVYVLVAYYPEAKIYAFNRFRSNLELYGKCKLTNLRGK